MGLKSETAAFPPASYALTDVIIRTGVKTNKIMAAAASSGTGILTDFENQLNRSLSATADLTAAYLRFSHRAEKDAS